MENEEMNLAELLKDTAEENQTRKILAILEESKDQQEAKEKVKALLKKQSLHKQQTEGRPTTSCFCPWYKNNSRKKRKSKEVI